MILNTWTDKGWTEPVQIVEMDELGQILEDPAFIVWISPLIEVILCDYCRRKNNFVMRPETERCQYCGADLDQGYRLLGRRNEPGAPIVYVRMLPGPGSSTPDEAPRGPEPL